MLFEEESAKRGHASDSEGPQEADSEAERPSQSYLLAAVTKQGLCRSRSDLDAGTAAPLTWKPEKMCIC